jgi:hypothetical protein
MMMKAIEINSKTDKNGHLKIEYKLDKSEKKVRILILLEEEQTEPDDEKLWMNSISSNPAFDFLKNSEEDIYSLNDGEPFNG